jgi:probable HAF family extracellular repeat protein
MNKCGSGMGRLLLLVVTLSVATMAAGPTLTFKFRTESIPGAMETDIFGVNNSQVGVGSYVDGSGVRHGFVASAGKVTTLDDPKGVSTYCFAVNNLGAIVGYYATSSFVAQAFLYENGTFTDIGPA